MKTQNNLLEALYFYDKKAKTRWPCTSANFISPSVKTSTWFPFMTMNNRSKPHGEEGMDK